MYRIKDQVVQWKGEYFNQDNSQGWGHKAAKAKEIEKLPTPSSNDNYGASESGMSPPEIYLFKLYSIPYCFSQHHCTIKKVKTVSILTGLRWSLSPESYLFHIHVTYDLKLLNNWEKSSWSFCRLNLLKFIQNGLYFKFILILIFWLQLDWKLPQPCQSKLCAIWDATLLSSTQKIEIPSLHRTNETKKCTEIMQSLKIGNNYVNIQSLNINYPSFFKIYQYLSEMYCGRIHESVYTYQKHNWCNRIYTTSHTIYT